MTSTTDPQLVTAAEAARLLGVTRRRVLELAAASADFPPAEHTATGGRVWPRVAVQAWGAHPPRPGTGLHRTRRPAGRRPSPTDLGR
jgi:predicted DNA-binding transcriptional regulator AlpA